MKIIKYEFDKNVQLGIVDENDIIPITIEDELPENYNDLKSLILDWPLVEKRLNQIQKANKSRISQDEVEIQAPLSNPEKFLAIGLNYKKHRAESIDAGITPPRNQMWFTKQISCINKPYGDVLKPETTMMLDYEVELALIIGKQCNQIKASDAHQFIFGYMICNDFSMRDWQLHNMPERLETMIGKSYDTHGPIGPCVVTKEEIDDPHNLKISCYVNGDLRQSSNTNDMIWNCYEQIEYLSNAMTLKPGDIISTGTPPGSGFSPRGSSGKADKDRKGNVFLEPGDVVRCEIEGIGFLKNKIITDE